MGMLARLGVVLGLDSAEFQKGIADANKKLDNFSAQMPKMAAIAGAAFAAATYKALQYADAVADTAKANDVAIASVLALSSALQQNGGAADNAGRLLSSFTAKIDDAAQGGLEAQKTFARIGVSLDDLAKMDSETMFAKVVTQLSLMEDPISRNATAMNLFGKAAKGVDWVGMAGDLDGAKEKYEKYAEAVGVAAELNDKLEASTKNATLAFTNAALPALNELFDALQKDSGAMEFFGGVVKTVVETIAILIKYTSTVVMTLVENIKFLGRTIENVFAGNFSTIVDDYRETSEKIKQMVAADEAFAEKVLSGELYKSKGGGATPFAGRQVTKAKDPEAEKADKLRESLELAKKISQEYERQSQFDLSQLRLKAELNSLTSKEREVAEAVMQMRQKQSDELAKIDSKMQDAIIKKEVELAEELGRQKNIVAERSEFFIMSTQAEILAIQQEQNTFSFGWETAFAQYAEDAYNYSALGKSYFQTMTNAMNSAIDNFVQNGKFSFKDFTSSLIKDLIAIQLKMQAMQLFSMGMKFFGFTMPATGAVPAGKAVGGYVGAGESYMVGERGPELFVPQGAGTIIPNDRLANQMQSSQPTTVYNGPYIANLSAIDTQSGTEFLAKNKMAIWAANSSAGRSLPASR